MHSIKKEIKQDDSTIETILITSNDNHKLELTKKYKLDRKIKENRIVKGFKHSIFGTEIGIKAEGFSTMAILATLIAVGSLCIMYMMFKV